MGLTPLEGLVMGGRTGDIKQSDTPADKLVGTAQMGDLVVSRL